MVDRIAHKVYQRVLELLENAAIDFHRGAVDVQFRLLAAVTREVAHDFRKGFEQGGEGQHQCLLHLVQQIVHHVRE